MEKIHKSSGNPFDDTDTLSVDLTVEPDIYSPNIDSFGTYVDKVPPLHLLKHGIRCPCGSRKDKIYKTHAQFSSHIKTKSHRLWLISVNSNKTNYYVDCEKLQDVVKSQRQIIAKLERDLSRQTSITYHLTSQLDEQKRLPNNLSIID